MKDIRALKSLMLANFRPLSARMTDVFFVVIFLLFLLPLNARAEGANLYLAPRTGTVVIDSQFSLTVRVNTGGEEINTAEGDIYFDNDVLEVVSVNRGESPFKTWPIEPVYSNSAGTVNFAGGIPRVGYKGSDGYLVRIDFKAKRVGLTQIGFSTGSALANDGKGTNILSAMSGAAVTISPKVEVPSAEEKKEDVEKMEEKKVDENPEITKELSTTTVDTMPPIFVGVQIGNFAGDWPELNFLADDTGSGLAGFTVEVDLVKVSEGALTEATSTVKLTALTPGKHKALIHIVDDAGNEAVRQIEFEVPILEAPIVKNFSREVKSGEQFFANGTALTNGAVDIVLKTGGQIVSSSTVNVDNDGNWFFVNNAKLADGKYSFVLSFRNLNGLRSLPTADYDFLVTPPIFMVIGDYVVRYFTVFASLLFMTILIFAGSIYLYRFFRGRIRAESEEAQQVTKSYLENFSQIIDEEFARLAKYEGTASYQKEKDKTRRSLKARLGVTEKKVIKEVEDLEGVMR